MKLSLAFALLVAALVISTPVAHRDPIMLLDTRRIPTIEEQIVCASVEAQVPAHMALNRAYHESRFNPKAHNKCCWGVFALNARWFPGAERMSAQENIKVGLKYYKYWLTRCGGREACAVRGYTRGHL